MGLSDAESIQKGFGGIDAYREDHRDASEAEKFLGDALARGMTVQEAAIEYKLHKQGGGMQPQAPMQSQVPAQQGGGTVVSRNMGAGSQQGAASPYAPPAMRAAAPRAQMHEFVPGPMQGGGRGAMADMNPARAPGGMSAGPEQQPGGFPGVQTKQDFEAVLRAAPQMAAQVAARQPRRRSVEEELALIDARTSGQRDVVGAKGEEARKTADLNNKSRDGRAERSLKAKQEMQKFAESERWRRLQASMAAMFQRTKMNKAGAADHAEAKMLLSTIGNLRTNIAKLRSSIVELANDPEAAAQIQEWEAELDAYEEALNDVRATRGQAPVDRKAGKIGGAPAAPKPAPAKSLSTPEDIDSFMQGN